MPVCDACGKPFDGNNPKSSLLSHISHKVECKEYYGEAKLKMMRRDAKLHSKQKWNNKDSTKDAQSERYRFEKEKRQQINKDKYIKKTSMEGRAFTQLFDMVFKECG